MITENGHAKRPAAMQRGVHCWGNGSALPLSARAGIQDAVRGLIDKTGAFADGEVDDTRQFFDNKSAQTVASTVPLYMLLAWHLVRSSSCLNREKEATEQRRRHRLL